MRRRLVVIGLILSAFTAFADDAVSPNEIRINMLLTDGLLHNRDAIGTGLDAAGVSTMVVGLAIDPDAEQMPTDGLDPEPPGRAPRARRKLAARPRRLDPPSSMRIHSRYGEP